MVHGDLHAQNFAYFAESHRVKMFDMQMWGMGSPAVELAYFLSSNTNAEDIQGEACLIRLYYSEFMSSSKLDLTKYSIGEFCTDIRRAQVEFSVATIIRRAMFETPQTVGATIQKQGAIAESMQKVLLEREVRFLQKMKQIWRTNRTFNSNLFDDLIAT